MKSAQILAMMGLLGTQSVFASDELCVDPESSKCFATIQGAVNAAAAGDRIIIFPNPDPRGYRENVIINKPNLTLKGVFHQDQYLTVKEFQTKEQIRDLEAYGQERCSPVIVDTCQTTAFPTSCGGDGFTISQPGTTLEKLTIRHSINAILLQNASNTKIQDICVIESETGISGTGNQVKVSENKFLGIRLNEAIILRGNNGEVNGNRLINTDGILLDGNGIQVEHNFISLTTDNSCIDVRGNNAKIVNNKMNTCTTAAIHSEGSNTVILKNSIKQTADDSTSIESIGNNVQVSFNEIFLSSDSGIEHRGNNGSIDHNIVRGTGVDSNEPGIQILGNNNQVLNNEVSNNTHAGISNESGNGNRYEHNISKENGKSGIRIQAGNGNIVAENQTFKNEGEGLNNGTAATNTVFVDNVSFKNRTDVCNSGSIATFDGNSFKTGGATTPCVVEQ